LPASWRSRTRHLAPAHLDRKGPGADARVARAALGPLPARIRARHSGRPRQVANRSELSHDRCGRRLARRGLQRSIALLSAEDVISLLDLKPHPEGGHYRETFRDTQTTGSG